MSIWDLKGRQANVITANDRIFVVIDWTNKLRLVHPVDFSAASDAQYESNHATAQQLVDRINAASKIEVNRWQKWHPPVKDGTVGKFLYRWGRKKAA